jgi:hypothetical protein
LSLSLSGSASIDPLESIIVVDTPLGKKPCSVGSRDAEPGSRKTMLLLVVAGELIKQAKGRILLDFYTVSSQSPDGGNDAYGNLKSLSVSEVCYGTEFGFPWLNTILGDFMKLSSVVGVGVLQHAARAEIDRILKIDT